MENMESMSNEEGRAEQFPVGMRVLAVDDNPTCLRKLEELLLRCKYHVTKTMESKKALEMLREKSNMFDLVISDVEMPDADGFKLLEIGLEMDLPVIMLSAHSDYDSVMKGIIHGACDYLVKPVSLKELKNIWQHVVKKNIGSYKKIIGPSRQLLPASESAPSGSRKRKEKVDDSGDGDDESDREDEDGEGSEQDGEESSTRKKPRVVWSQELHQKFVHAVQQLGLDKAVPKKILDFMNIEGLTRENVASHLQKYRLYLKKIDEGQQQNMSQDAFGSRDSSYFHMAQLDGLRDYTSTRQLPSSSLLTRSSLNKFHPSVYSSINLQGSNSANPFGTYHSPLLSRSQNMNLSPLDPLQFPRSKCSPYMGEFKGIGDRGIGSSFLDSRMPFGSSSTSMPSASSNNLMLQENFTHNLHGASDGNQSCLEGALSNSSSLNINVDGLPRFPSHHSWQGNLKTTTRYPSNSLPLTHAFGQDQGNGLGDYNTSLVCPSNPVGVMQCEPPLLGDFMQNMNEQNCPMMNSTFGNVDFPLPVDNNMMSPVEDSATTLNSRECVGNFTMMEPEMRSGKMDNALVDNQHDVFDDIMNEMLKHDENNGMVSVPARFGLDSFPPP